MKNATILSLSILFFSACTKQNDLPLHSQYYSDDIIKIKTFLKDSLENTDLSAIDFHKAVRSVIDSGNINFVRIPFKGISITKSFIMVNADKQGNCLNGVIVNISARKKSAPNEAFNGIINISSLKQKEIRKINVVDGCIVKPGLENSSVAPSKPQDNELPEVIVVAYMPTVESEITWMDWMNLLDLYGTTGYEVYGGSGSTAGGYGYYSPLDPYVNSLDLPDVTDSIPNDDEVGITDDNGIPEDNTKIVEFEPVEFFDAISVAAYMECFNTIPDENALCSIEIFADLPVNGEPNNFFNWAEGSPGHSFLQIRKTQGTSTVQQTIGF